MADRKANLLVTMVFDENLDIRKQINTELELKNEITKDLQHLIAGREIKHFVVADDEVINKKLTEERKVGKLKKIERIVKKELSPLSIDEMSNAEIQIREVLEKE